MKIGQVLLEKYEVVKYINSGGTGDVYLVKHLSLNTTMAMKVVNKSEAVTQEYINEAHTLKGLRHLQLPRVIDIFELDSNLCIIRDFIDGLTLEEHVDTYGPMPFDEVVKSTKELLSVLSYLHRQNQPIIYRDLKPSNIIVVENGELSLIDFGTTRTFVPGKSMDTVSLGTQGYAAPEQYGGNQSDARTDIYGLGAVMYFMYTGDHFCDVNENSKFNKFTTQSGKKLKVIIKKAMSIMQEDRYQSADEMIDYLNFRGSEETKLLGAASNNSVTQKSKISVGIMGLTRGVGVTHFSLMVASVVNRQLGKVCYVERERSGALTVYEKYIEDIEWDSSHSSKNFKYKGVKFINRDNADEFQKLFASTDTSIIIDYSNQHFLVNDFLRNQYKFFVIPSQAWAIRHVDIINSMKSYQDVTFIVNLTTEKGAKQLIKWLDLPRKRTLLMGFIDDVYSDSNAHQTINHALNFSQKKKRYKLFGVI